MNVAVGVVYNYAQHILITQRAAHISCGGLWEFPGGKLEHNETPEDALVRELKEEVNLNVLKFDFITKIEATRSDQNLFLYVFLVHEFTGQATCLESQTNLLWVPPQALKNYEFPQPNLHILAWIKQYFIH